MLSYALLKQKLKKLGGLMGYKDGVSFGGLGVCSIRRDKRHYIDDIREYTYV